MSVHKQCGEQIRWARRDDDSTKWLPPLEFAGQAYIFGEDDAAILVNTYRPHNCDPDKVEAWQEYKARLAEIEARQVETPSPIPSGMTDWEIAKQRREEEVWEDALKRKCPKCDAKKGVKCHKLDHKFKATGELVETKMPHSERIAS